MRAAAICFLLCCNVALAQNQSPPTQFEIARHTFFDFGPPNDFYELYLVRPAKDGTSVERITLTPAADSCIQPAKIEAAKGELAETVGALLGTSNPCTIPERELRRELKRCKKCSVFSGANVSMQVQCGSQPRVIRSDILDRDMFDPNAKTPEHTSWTMHLLAEIDQALGPGVMERPIFPISATQDSQASALTPDSDVIRDIAAGKYDQLFRGAPDKVSELYRAAQVRPPLPTVRLVSSEPFRPEFVVEPLYPPLARLARIEGTVNFTVEVTSDGNTANFTIVNGHPMLRPATEEAVKKWKFATDVAGQRITAGINFATNCAPKNQ